MGINLIFMYCNHFLLAGSAARAPRAAWRGC